MEDNIPSFFKESEFDFREPQVGHLERFEHKLKNTQGKRKLPWSWMSIAASIVLIIGFAFGKYSQKPTTVLGSISPKMQEVESYFVSTINVELKEIEKNRSLETESIIEFAINEIENLEDQYQTFAKDLKKDNNNQRAIISAMIKNYQKRLEILQSVLDQIERIKNPIKFMNETII